jgi:hypothetical protein
MSTKSYQDSLTESLKDTSEARAYIKAALDEDDAGFVMAVKNVHASLVKADEAKLKGELFPDYLMIRDTLLHDDLGGCGQRIYTTAGAGYTKVKYIRSDLYEAAMRLRAEGVPVKNGLAYYFGLLKERLRENIENYVEHNSWMGDTERGFYSTDELDFDKLCAEIDKLGEEIRAAAPSPGEK